jgi:hypothetical protein
MSQQFSNMLSQREISEDVAMPSTLRMRHNSSIDSAKVPVRLLLCCFIISRENRRTQNVGSNTFAMLPLDNSIVLQRVGRSIAESIMTPVERQDFTQPVLPLVFQYQMLEAEKH